ncbi:MAG: hypothetical protein M3R36_17910 [Bacteroidota bacterium]|nr:hypothetical protein [Bacteroidota bacterium]
MKQYITLLLLFLPGIVFNFGFNKVCIADSDNGINGRYINETYLDQIPDSIPGLVAAYCLEMNFHNSDSVEIFNGFEEYKLAYKKDGNKYLLINASRGKDFTFVLNVEGSILLIDSAWTGNSVNSTFIKTKLNSRYGSKWIFDQYVNEKIIAGDYTLFENDSSVNQTVSFMPDGTVTGLENYSTYMVRYSGDCVGETNPVSNTITLKSNDGRNDTYAFIIDRKNNLLSIYEIAPPVEDIKGEREILNLKFDSRK